MQKPEVVFFFQSLRNAYFISSENLRFEKEIQFFSQMTRNVHLLLFVIATSASLEKQSRH